MEGLQNVDKENFFERPAKPLTISELVRRHIFDPNHITNDDELKNARIELSNVVTIDANNFAIGGSTILD